MLAWIFVSSHFLAEGGADISSLCLGWRHWHCSGSHISSCKAVQPDANRKSTAGPSKVAVKKTTVDTTKAVAKAAKKEEEDQKREFKRSGWEAAKRATLAKLGMYSQQQLENNRDEDGNNVIEAVLKEQARMREEQKHMTVQFWCTLIDRHRLTGGVCDQLAPPEKAETISRQLDAALKAAHHSNPAMKSATPLKRMLPYMRTINKLDLFGLRKGSFQTLQCPHQCPKY